MYLKLMNEKVSKNYYCVGLDELTGHYILAVHIAWIASYERYYLITQSEYEAFGTEELDTVADNCYKGLMPDRYLGSGNTRDYQDYVFPNYLYYNGYYCHETIYRKRKVWATHQTPKEDFLRFKLFQTKNKSFYGVYPDFDIILHSENKDPQHFSLPKNITVQSFIITLQQERIFIADDAWSLQINTTSPIALCRFEKTSITYEHCKPDDLLQLVLNHQYELTLQVSR